MRRDTDESLAPARLFPPGLPWLAPWTADAVVARLEPLVVEARRQRLLRVLAGRLDSVVVLMDAPHDPHNGAAVLRSCDAFGVQECHVVPRQHGVFQAATGVAKGTERWVDSIEHATVGDAVATLKGRGFQLVATHPEGALAPPDLRRLDRVAVVMGNEHDGIADSLRAACDHSVRIPMRGFVESLNVSVSAAILLQAATADRPGDLSPERHQELYARGLYRSVARAADVLAASDPAEFAARAAAAAERRTDDGP